MVVCEKGKNLEHKPSKLSKPHKHLSDIKQIIQPVYLIWLT